MAADERRDALVERLFEATLGTWDLLTVYLGGRLGLYRALADRGALTAPALAEATGTNERYVREWLEQQAASGIVDVDDAGKDAEEHLRGSRLDDRVSFQCRDVFKVPSDDLQRFYHGFGVLHCLPVGMVGESTVGTGTVMRADTVRRYGDEAGFQGFEVLPIENDFYRFYRLEPQT